MSALEDVRALLGASTLAEEYTRTLASAEANLPALIEEIASSALMLSEVAAGSYEHPNGFQKLLLLKSEREVKLLLHSWSEASLRRAVAADHAHNHRWPFATLVLMGAYRSECFDVVPGANGDHYHYRYRSPENDGAYRLEQDGRAELKTVLSFDLGLGASCWSDSSTIHRVAGIRLPLHTLFIQGAPERSETSVVTPEPAQQTGAVSIRRFTSEQWHKRASAVIETLSGQVSASSC